MNARKYFFVLSSIFFICLVVSGIVLLTSLKMPEKEPENYNKMSNMSIIEEIVQPIKIEMDAFNVLLLGGDYGGANTDTMMLVNYNPTTGKASLLSIPRDTKVKIRGSSIPKINAAYSAGGADYTVSTVSKLLNNIEIKYYVFIETSAFRSVINILDGVYYNVPANMDYDDPSQNLHIHLKKGYQKLNGAQAEQFMRFRQPTIYNSEIRKFYDGSDIKRIEAQQSFVKEVLRQKLNVKYISKADDIVRTIFKYVKTNISMNDALRIVQSATKINPDEVQFFKLPGEPRFEDYWYFIPYRNEANEIIKKNFTVPPSKQSKKGTTIENSEEDVELVE